jgi:hypothetical protein
MATRSTHIIAEEMAIDERLRSNVAKNTFLSAPGGIDINWSLGYSAEVLNYQ